MRCLLDFRFRRGRSAAVGWLFRLTGDLAGSVSTDRVTAQQTDQFDGPGRGVQIDEAADGSSQGEAVAGAEDIESLALLIGAAVRFGIGQHVARVDCLVDQVESRDALGEDVGSRVDAGIHILGIGGR